MSANANRIELFNYIAAPLARRESSTNIEMCLLQKNMLVHGMLNRCVIECKSNQTTSLSSRTNQQKNDIRKKLWHLIWNCAKIVILLLQIRLSMRMVWHDNAFRMSQLHFKRLHIWCAATHLFATTCRFNSTYRSSNGSHYRCSSAIKKHSIAKRLFMP